MKSLEEKFWSKVSVSSNEDCWIWTGATYDSGYGQLVINGKKTRAHRISYEINIGIIPEGLLVMHSCDNPPCVNPNHLSLGTVADNNDDCQKKGRKTQSALLIMHGEGNPSSKLTKSQVLNIRERYIPRDAQNGGAALAREYGVSRQCISHIIRGETWTHGA